MTPADAGTLVLALLGAGVIASGWGWTRAGRQIDVVARVSLDNAWGGV